MARSRVITSSDLEREKKRREGAQRKWIVEATRDGQRLRRGTLHAAEPKGAAQQCAAQLHKAGLLTEEPARLAVTAEPTGRLAAEWAARLIEGGAGWTLERWSEVAQTDLEDWLGGAP